MHPSPLHEPTEPDQSTAGRLLGIVRTTTLEVRGGAPVSDLEVTLDSSLEGELGLDSLARAHLLQRLRQAFRCQLPDTLLTQAKNPRDLLFAIQGADALESVQLEPATVIGTFGEGTEAPASTNTLVDVLAFHAAAHGRRPHVLLSEGDDVESMITYEELHGRAQVVAAWLLGRGLAPGDRVAIMLPTSAGFFFAFFGVLYAGGVPVPIYPPARLTELELHLRRQAGILRNARATTLITMVEALQVARLLRSQLKNLTTLATVEEMQAAPVPPAASKADDVALLQYTSGSTGDPKGVVLRHANLLANLRAMGRAIRASPSDRFVSWLPLYHDMGLIGAWLGSLYYAIPVWVMSPLAFLARPERWLWAIHRHRATLSAGPNFAFEFCLKSLEHGAFDGLDLRSLRWLANGAETVRADTLRRFIDGFREYGLRPESVAPVYGLAESAVGLAFPPAGRPPRIDRIDRAALTARQVAVPRALDAPQAVEFVACGHPLPEHEIRIVDATGHELGERHEGRLQFRGPSATSGYFSSPESTRRLFRGSWLESGDLAYVADGDVFITGRSKDVIVRGGRNLHPEEIEGAVSGLPGVRRGCVAAFAASDARSGSERLVVVAETRLTHREDLAALRDRIAAVTAELLEVPAEEVVLAPPRSIPKTSSGKLRRTAARDLYAAGRLGSRSPSVTRQVLRLARAGILPTLRRLVRGTGAHLYNAYWWTMIGLAAMIAWPAVVLLPWRPWRWAALRHTARAFFRLTATRLVAEHTERLPRSPHVVVSNHASYVDGLVLAAVLPREHRFVAKRELAGQFFAGLFLRRLGAVFVERFAAEQAVRDAAQLTQAAPLDGPLVFFPEGTLTRRPGLADFHVGAFVVAAETRLPVVPVAMRGNRSLLRGGQWFARRSALRVTVGPPIRPVGRDWSAAIHARDLARRTLLELTGEPDLAHGRGLPVSEDLSGGPREGRLATARG